eukprot:12778-Heterococcus_DN1.PRE.2
MRILLELERLCKLELDYCSRYKQTATGSLHLTLGAYRDLSGAPWPLPSVRAAECRLAEDATVLYQYHAIVIQHQAKLYWCGVCWPPYQTMGCYAVVSNLEDRCRVSTRCQCYTQSQTQELLFGKDSAAVQAGHIAPVQAVGGTVRFAPSQCLVYYEYSATLALITAAATDRYYTCVYVCAHLGDLGALKIGFELLRKRTDNSVPSPLVVYYPEHTWPDTLQITAKNHSLHIEITVKQCVYYCYIAVVKHAR